MVRERRLGVSRNNPKLRFDHWVAASITPRLFQIAEGNLVDFLSLHLDVGPLSNSIRDVLGWPGVFGFVITLSPPPGTLLQKGEPAYQTVVPSFATQNERHPTESLISADSLKRLNAIWSERLFLLALLNNASVVRTTVAPVRMEDLPRSLDIVVSDQRIYSLSGKDFSPPAEEGGFRRPNRQGSPLEHSRQLLGLHERSAAALEAVFFSKLRGDLHTVDLQARAKQRIDAARDLRQQLRGCLSNSLQVIEDCLVVDPARNAIAEWLLRSDRYSMPPQILKHELDILRRKCRSTGWPSLHEQYKRVGLDLLDIARQIAAEAL